MHNNISIVSRKLNIRHHDVYHGVLVQGTFCTLPSMLCNTNCARRLESWQVHYTPDSRLAPSQWETGLLCNDISHWLGASLESALHYIFVPTMPIPLAVTAKGMMGWRDVTKLSQISWQRGFVKQINNCHYKDLISVQCKWFHDKAFES